MKYILLFFAIICTKNFFGQNFKNTIYILRDENTKDSTLISDNYYYYLDSENYIHFVRNGFRYNEFFPAVDSLSTNDSLHSEINYIQKYEPHSESVFKLRKSKTGLTIQFKGEKESNYLSFKNITKYLGRTFGDGLNITVDYAQNIFLGFEEVIFRNKKVKCYKFSNCYCDGYSNSISGCKIIYLHPETLIPLKIEYIDFDCKTKVAIMNSPDKITYSLFGIFEIQTKQNLNLHIWGKSKL